MERFQRVREILDEAAVGGSDATIGFHGAFWRGTTRDEIDGGCPDDVPTPAQLTWRATNAPVASSRTDDIWFNDPQRGRAVNSNGQIVHTEDGFTTWQQQLHDPGVYFRCVGFASETRGWAGTLTAGKRLFETVDGGANWTNVTNLPRWPHQRSVACRSSTSPSSTSG